MTKLRVQGLLSCLHAGKARSVSLAIVAALGISASGCSTTSDGSFTGKSTNARGIEFIESGRYREAETLLLGLIKDQERQHGNVSLQVSYPLYNLGWLYRLQGRYAEAEPLERRAVFLQEQLGAPPKTLAKTLDEFGYLLLLQGRYSDAEPLFQRALSLQERSLAANDPDTVGSLENIGYLYRLEGRYSEARSLYERVLSIREKSGNPDISALAQALTNLGALDVLQGRFAEAERLEQRALRLRETKGGPERAEVADSLFDLGNLYRAEGRFADGEKSFKRAIAVQTVAAGPHHLLVATKGLAGLVQLYKEQGNIADALRSSNGETDILEQHLIDGRAQRSVASMTERHLFRDAFLENVALNYANSGSTDRATVGRSFVAAQYANVTTAGQALSRMAARVAGSNGSLGADIRRLQDLGDRWQQLDSMLLQGVSNLPSGGTENTAQDVRAELEVTDRELTVLATKVGRDFPGYSDIASPKAIDLNTVQKLLAPDEVMLVYVTNPDCTWLWAVRSDSARLYRLGLSERDIANEVGSLRSFLDPDVNPSLRPFPASLAYNFYRHILAPAELMIRGARHLIVVPDKALNSLPLSVLVIEPPSHDPVDQADHRKVHWLAADYAVSVLPSVASLHALRTFARPSRASLPFFGIGDPVLGDVLHDGSRGRGMVTGIGPVLRSSIDVARLQPLRDSDAMTRAVEALPSLPETATELKAVAQIVGATKNDLLLAQRATETDLASSPLERYRIIEFATHGLKQGDLGLDEPALVLTPTHRSGVHDDGLLTASKIAVMKLDADWVVLSACNTAAGGNSDSGPFSALAKSFFYAGARSVLVSHWSVPSGPTVLITATAFAQLTEHPEIGRAEALRRSMMAMMSPSNPVEFSHPLVWAPFSLTGEGARDQIITAASN